MKQNELTIEIPNDKVVDWEESKKQNKIVLKDKQLTYEDVCKKLFKNKNILFYTSSNGDIENTLFLDTADWLYDKNNATTKHQLECILAKNKLANVAKYLNNGWKPNISNQDFGYFIFRNECCEEFSITVSDEYEYNNNVLFKAKKLAQQAIEILGEETIKLALEPLGF